MAPATFSLEVIHSARAASQAKPSRTSLFKSLVAILHLSRRLQAERILRQHADLFDKSSQSLDLTKLKDR
jgi:hypothetical protein